MAKLTPFRWNQFALAFDSRIHQLVKRLGEKRIWGAKIDPHRNYDFFEPPWIISLGDIRYLLQLSDGGLIDFFKKTKNSAEWMIAITARQIAMWPGRSNLRFIEYQLTGSNEKNASVPSGVGELNYLWWRLEHYFGITPNNPALFSDELLIFALNMAKLMWDSKDRFFNDTEIICNLVISDKAKSNSEIDKAKFATWSPQGYNAPIELIAVKIKPGMVTEHEWWEALALRVSMLALPAGEEATRQACQYLNVPETEDWMVLRAE